MRVVTTHTASFAHALEPGAVVFAPAELRPYVGSVLADIIRKLHGRLPWIVRKLISAEALIELAHMLLERRELPGSAPVAYKFDAEGVARRVEHPGYNGLGLP